MPSKLKIKNVNMRLGATPARFAQKFLDLKPLEKCPNICFELILIVVGRGSARL